MINIDGIYLLNLSEFLNVNFICASVHEDVLEEASQDFGYCLGVLHHVPDTLSGLRSCSKLLKKNAPFLLYLYYNLENRPVWYRSIWQVSNILRRVVSILPFSAKKFVTSIIAFFIFDEIISLQIFISGFIILSGLLYLINIASIEKQSYKN